MMWYSTPYYYYQQNNRHNTLESGQRKMSRRITVGTLWNNQRMIWNKFRILYPPLMLVLLFIHGPSHHHQPHGCYANTVESSAKPPSHNYYTLLLVKSIPLPRKATYVVWRYISHCKFAIFILPSLILLLLALANETATRTTVTPSPLPLSLCHQQWDNCCILLLLLFATYYDTTEGMTTWTTLAS